MAGNLPEKFSAQLEIIGINPFVFIPAETLQKIFERAGTDRSPIRVWGKVNGLPYEQTLVKYKGEWRLYINLEMLANSPKRIGELIEVSISFNPKKKVEKVVPEKFLKALEKDKKAKTVFDGLVPSKKSEIIRYLVNLKTAAALEKNIQRALNFLKGKERFIGRDKP